MSTSGFVISTAAVILGTLGALYGYPSTAVGAFVAVVYIYFVDTRRSV